jgi:hypothetical protein
MDKFIKAYQSGDWSELREYRWKDLNRCLGGDEREGDDFMRHKYMYNFETLAYILGDQGFSFIQRFKALPIDNPAYEFISLYVDAVKL